MKKIFSYFLIIFLGLTKALVAKAVCPVCTVAVVGGIGISRWLGIDDTISGLWVGGITVSLIMWTLDWFKRKNINFKGKSIVTTISYVVLIIVPLYFVKDIWHPLNTLWGINKLFLGILVGIISFWNGAAYYEYLKKNNNNHAYFPFQKVVMPISSLIICSFVFYFLTK